jgi:hypothetical protein
MITYINPTAISWTFGFLFVAILGEDLAYHTFYITVDNYCLDKAGDFSVDLPVYDYVLGDTTVVGFPHVDQGDSGIDCGTVDY